MIVSSVDDENGAVGGSQEKTADTSSAPDACDKDLSKEQLESIFAEEDPHKQFELFLSCLGMGCPGRMSTSVRIVAEYDYLNVMFCREQNFTTEQTVAFRALARSVFEKSVVKGELDLDGAFQAFTERVLSLAVAPEEKQANSPEKQEAQPEEGQLSCGGSEGEPVTPAMAARPTSRGKQADGGALIKGGVEPLPGNSAEGHVSFREDDGGGQETAGVAATAVEPVFSVADVAAITQFVARGLYRNFALYRLCFQRDAAYRTEVRNVQVETPLVPPPLREAEAS